jgi:hypothetical protein
MSLVICTMPQCQTTAGCVCGMATAKIGEAIPILDAEYVCDVPIELGRVTKLKVRGDKVIAETDSGMQMILPVHRE